MPLYRLERPLPVLDRPVLVAAFDGWVDAGSAATGALAIVAEGGTTLATFDADALFDFRARRPTLDIRDGRPATLDWPELTLRHTQRHGRDLLTLGGPEPDFRWHALSEELLELLALLGVREWISLGAIPAAVPHARAVPILGTESAPGLLRGQVTAGPTGLLRVPAAVLSVLEMAAAKAGLAAVGYFAQIPHYVSGGYAPASVALLRTLEQHLGIDLPRGDLIEEAGRLRTRLDAAVAADETTRTYVERLEAMVDEERQPAGDDLISEIERFLREGRGDGDAPGPRG
ncbi:MAG TPA: PAC2 family protein [Candidatus Limnocylindrales bacterium]